MPVYKNMTTEYNSRAVWSLVIKGKDVVYRIMIFEMVSDNRRLEFPLIYWASFTRAIDEIDNAVNDLKTNHQLKYSYYIGGGYYVSVTSSYGCASTSGKNYLKHFIENVFKIVVKSCKNKSKI